jgi:branched-chain amino acid transport system ATP-binding protein
MSLLRINGLSKSFGGLRAVDGLSFEVTRGEVVGLLGPNGSGKTTAMNLISGALRADSGEIVFDGHCIEKLPPHRIARLGVARTFQLVRVLGTMSTAENVQAGLAFGSKHVFGAAARDASLVLLDRVGLRDRADLPASELTYIDQKRLELARALALGPQLLLLDEWLAGLNPSELREGIALIHDLRARGVTIILVEHVMDAVRALCDRCVVMSAGTKLAEGKTQDVLARDDVISAYLGVDHA